MATGGGIGDEGRGWQTVDYSRNKGSQKREALSERSDMLGVSVENKMRKINNVEEFVVLFKVKVQREGSGRFRALNKVTTALEWQNGNGFQTTILYSMCTAVEHKNMAEAECTVFSRVNYKSSNTMGFTKEMGSLTSQM